MSKLPAEYSHCGCQATERRYEHGIRIPFSEPIPGMVGKVRVYDADRLLLDPVGGLPPKAFAEWDRSRTSEMYHWTVDRLALSESARDLELHSLKIGEIYVVRNIPAYHFIGVNRPRREEDELIERLQSCFRYKDHTREELARAADLLNPRHHTLDWPVTPPRQNWELLFYNPTDRAVAFSATLAGAHVFLHH